jgi:hypothetical protein
LEITGDQSSQNMIITNCGTDNSTKVGGRKKEAMKQKKKESHRITMKFIFKEAVKGAQRNVLSYVPSGA